MNNIRLGFITRQNNQTSGRTTNSVSLGKLRNSPGSLSRIIKYKNENVEMSKNVEKTLNKIYVNYTHVDIEEDISILPTLNPNIRIITHRFNLENTNPDSKFYTSAIVYFDDNILTNVNNMNTIKIAGEGCINYSIPYFVVDSTNNYYVNQTENNPIISTIISGSGKFAGIKGHVETKYIEDKSYMTIIYEA
jgi:hypothetical protein